MKKKIWGVAIAATAVLCTGCAKVPDMTTEQNNAVAEYAASVLVSRSYSYRARYVDDLEPLTEPATENESETETEAPSIVPVEESSSAGESETTAEFNIAKDMGLDSVKVSYESYKIVDEYPDDPEALFSFEPQEGCKFLVVSLKVHNPTEETITLNNTSSDNIIKLTIGKKRCNNYANLLTNDITRLKDVKIEPGADYESVVVFMVGDEILDEMTEFELSVNSGKTITVRK